MSGKIKEFPISKLRAVQALIETEEDGEDIVRFAVLFYGLLRELSEVQIDRFVNLFCPPHPGRPDGRCSDEKPENGFDADKREVVCLRCALLAMHRGQGVWHTKYRPALVLGPVAWAPPEKEPPEKPVFARRSNGKVEAFRLDEMQLLQYMIDTEVDSNKEQEHQRCLLTDFLRALSLDQMCRMLDLLCPPHPGSPDLRCSNEYPENGFADAEGGPDCLRCGLLVVHSGRITWDAPRKLQLELRPAPNARDKEEAPAQSPEPRGRILIVDDDKNVQRAFRYSLRRHDLVSAMSGDAARQILEQDRCFDLILCDVVMPGMPSHEFFAWLAAVEPDLAIRVVFMTGDLTAAQCDFFRLMPNRRFEKPITPAALKVLVRELLAR